MGDGDHVCDCTGPDMTCPTCGFVFRVAPISVSIEIYDKSTKLFSDAFNCEDVYTAISALRQAANKLERR